MDAEEATRNENESESMRASMPPPLPRDVTQKKRAFSPPPWGGKANESVAVRKFISREHQQQLSPPHDPRGYTKSICSTTTSEQSAITEPTSNTQHNRLEKKREKQKFLKFASILLKLLEKRDPVAYTKATAVIRECNEKKRKNEPGYESLGESMRKPLKEVVSKSYWKKAQDYFSNKQRKRKQLEKSDSFSLEGNLPDTSHAFLAGDALSQIPFESDSVRPRSVHTTYRSSSPKYDRREKRQRFWTFVRVLMHYLERKDPSMYTLAKHTIMDCAKRNERREPGYKSFSTSTKWRLQQIVDPLYWSKAEAHVNRLFSGEENQRSHNANLGPPGHHRDVWGSALIDESHPLALSMVESGKSASDLQETMMASHAFLESPPPDFLSRALSPEADAWDACPPLNGWNFHMDDFDEADAPPNKRMRTYFHE